MSRVFVLEEKDGFFVEHTQAFPSLRAAREFLSKHAGTGTYTILAVVESGIGVDAQPVTVRKIRRGELHHRRRRSISSPAVEPGSREA
jgi:hypothetical protein